MSAPFPFLDFFAGSGLVTWAMAPDFACAWANDVCSRKAAVYRANHGDGHFHLGSVEDVRGAELPPAALSWASFPCQDLSLAGRMEGLGASRSGLVWQWLRVMDEMDAAGKRPPILVVENVVGLVAANGGAAYRALHAALAERGYRAGPLLLDAARWLPQSRQRIFVVAARRGIDLTGLAGDTPGWAQPKTLSDRCAGLDAVWWRLPEPEPRRITLDDVVEPDAEPHDLATCRRNLSLIPPKHWARLLDERDAGRAVFPGYRRIREGGQVLELRFDGLAGCLRTPKGGSSRQILVVADASAPRGFHTRLLSAREAARLMGAPDSFALPGSHSAAYKAMGDAVAAPAVRFLADSLLAPLARRAASVVS